MMRNQSLLAAAVAVIVLAGAASLSWAQAEQRFNVNRDTCTNSSGGTENCNGGARLTFRIGKGQYNGGEMGWFGWDVPAVTSWIEAELLNQGYNDLQDLVNSGGITVRFEVAIPESEVFRPLDQKDVGLMTRHTDSDWVEGDATDWDLPYGWTYGTTAATMTAPLNIHPDFDPAPPGWKNLYQGWNNQWLKNIEGNFNSVLYHGLTATIGTPVTDADVVWNSIPLDNAVWMQLLYSLAPDFQPTYPSTGLQTFGLGWDNTGQGLLDNVNVAAREMWGFGVGDPSLLITIENKSGLAGHPGDANGDLVVNVQDLSILATNWGADPATFSQGNFNDDTVVNVQDLSILATNWGWDGTGGAVPEPVSLALLGLGGLAMIRRRR